MIAPLTALDSATEAARAAVCDALNTQRAGEAATRIDSPPGAGKTDLAARLAVQSRQILGERCMLVTQTNEQAFDLARRLSLGFPRVPVALLARRDLPIPADLGTRRNLIVARDLAGLQTGPCIVIGNAAKWSWVTQANVAFDCQIIDEAFQLPDYRFQQISGLADRIVLVGDPGQIAPVITCEVERWRCDRTGPHVACPRAFSERHPAVRRLSLPVSRRLVPDTVSVLQPAFYPNLPFIALVNPDERRLITRAGVGDAVDSAIDAVEGGASAVQLELPRQVTGEVDPRLADTIVAVVERLMGRDAHVQDGARTLPLAPRMIGIVCAHVSQVNAIRERLPQRYSDILVETADRYQGLEREVVIVHHPLSGRADVSEFHLDAGRLCVMMSRHRVACFLVTRGGIDDLLSQHSPSGNRVLGLDDDPEFEGWRAHRSVVASLARQGRIVALSRR